MTDPQTPRILVHVTKGKRRVMEIQVFEPNVLDDELLEGIVAACERNAFDLNVVELRTKEHVVMRHGTAVESAPGETRTRIPTP